MLGPFEIRRPRFRRPVPGAGPVVTAGVAMTTGAADSSRAEHPSQAGFGDGRMPMPARHRGRPSGRPDTTWSPCRA